LVALTVGILVLCLLVFETKVAGSSLEPAQVGAPHEVAGSHAEMERQDGSERRLEGPGSGLIPVGSELHYDARLRLRMTIESDGPNKVSGGQRPLDLQSQGALIVSILARREGEVIFGYRLPDLTVTVGGRQSRSTQDWTRSIADGLTTGFEVRKDEFGRILGYRFPKSMTSDHRNWARGISAAFAFTVMHGADSATRQWKCTEQDSIGTFTVDYVRLGDGSVERRKVALVPHGFDKTDQKSVHLAGQARVAFDLEHGWIQHAVLEETVRFAIPGLGASMHSESSGSLKFRQVVKVPTVEVAWEGAWASVSGHLEKSAVVAEQFEQKRRQELEGKTLAGLLARIQELIVSGSQQSPEFFGALRMLANMIELQPDTAAEIADLIENFEVRGELAASLLTALGMAGGIKAQGVLADVFAEVRHDEALRSAAVDSMFQLENPADKLMSNLRQSVKFRRQLTELDGSTMLVLGALSARRSDGREVVEELLGQEAVARKSGTIRTWIEALGNSGDPRVMDLAKRYLLSDKEGDRVLALTAIRRVDSPVARDLIRRSARSDRSAMVRAHSLELIGEGRDQRMTGVLLERARSDASVDVRRAAIHGLSGRLRTEPGLRRSLQELMGSETDSDLQGLLRQIVG
jgi:hypothetical protein